MWFTCGSWWFLVVQARETRGDWLLALASCPALRCAPLAKYVDWHHPLSHLSAHRHGDRGKARKTKAQKLAHASAEGAAADATTSAVVPRPSCVTDLRSAVHRLGNHALASALVAQGPARQGTSER
jgi:hypothetical protein